jgi:transcriptional regulator with XRE-family HTH domain
MSSNSPRQVGRLIQAERVRRGLTQADLGKEANLSPCYIGQIENGHRPPLGVLHIVGESIAVRPKLKPEGKSIGPMLRAERLRAGLTVWKIERRMKVDRAWFTILERGLREPEPGEVFKFLRAIEGKRPLTMKRFSGVTWTETKAGLLERAEELVKCEAMLARYQAAGLEPPDFLVLQRIGLRDGVAAFAALADRKARKMERVKAHAAGWYLRNKFRIAFRNAEAKRRRMRHLMQSGLLDRPTHQRAV